MEPNDQLWTRRFWWLFFGALAIRILYAVFFPVDLVGDEAYYWDWGRHLDWGYYSKPPMVAWLMALAGWLGGNSLLAIKLAPALLTAAGTLALFHLTRRLYDARAGCWMAALVLAAPASAVLSIMFTIDAPLFLCWSLSLYLTWKWLNDDPGPGVALALTTALGAGYLSKPIQLLFPLMLLLFLALSPRDRPRLRRLSTYGILFGSLLFMLPVVWWNTQHDWITFAHTAHHFEKPDVHIAKLIARPLEFASSQLFLCGPVGWVLLAASLMGVARNWRRLGRSEWFLFCFSAPMLAAVYLMSFGQRVHPNWPLVFYISALVLVAGWGATALDLGPFLGRRRGWFPHAVRSAAILSLIAYVATFAISWTPWAGSRLDPTERQRGWHGLGQEIGAVLEGLPDPGHTLVITASRRQLASQLAFYLPGQPEVYRLEDPAQIHSQYGIWGGPGPDKAGWDALIILEGEEAAGLPPELQDAFDQVRPLGTVAVPIGANSTRAASLWHGTGFRQWPYPLPNTTP